MSCVWGIRSFHNLALKVWSFLCLVIKLALKRLVLFKLFLSAKVVS